MSITGVTAREFVRSTELPATRRGITKLDTPPLTFDPDQDQAWVVGPQILSFVQGVTVERREMISTSALFASLAADAVTQGIKSEEWYTTYANALTNLGWVLQETTRRRFDQEHTGSKVHEAVTEFIATLGVGGAALTIVTAALKAMQKVDDNKPWITLFDRQTRSEDITGFQIGLVDQKAEGDFQVKLMSFSLKLAQTHTQVLFVDFATFGVHMDSIGSTVTVSDAVLQGAMPALKERLKAYVRSYVSEVKLPPLPEPGA
jgi:hypothetical protein